MYAVDLPSHGESPALSGAQTIGAFADALTGFLTEQDSLVINAVGSSMGARSLIQ